MKQTTPAPVYYKNDFSSSKMVDYMSRLCSIRSYLRDNLIQNMEKRFHEQVSVSEATSCP